MTERDRVQVFKKDVTFGGEEKSCSVVFWKDSVHRKLCSSAFGCFRPRENM